MGQLKQFIGDEITEPKKRRRVGFVPVDTGVVPNECIKIVMVSCIEQVCAPDALYIDPVDLNDFFDDDGKIYGYQELKITIWVSSVSFHAYADISFQSSVNGGKGITDLKMTFQKIFGENILEKKEEFLQTFSTESHYIRSAVSSGEILQHNVSTGYQNHSNSHFDTEASDVQVIRMTARNTHFGHLYNRLVSLVYLLVDGSDPIDVDDPKWELYILVRKSIGPPETTQYLLLGFAAIYRFFHYPDGFRLRLSQILILPPHQRKGHGRRLLQTLNSIAVSENAYDLTVEEPLDHLQHIRKTIDTSRLLAFKPVSDALDSTIPHLTLPNKPPLDLIENVRNSLKINARHFSSCWEILLYLRMGRDADLMEKFRSFIRRGIVKSGDSDFVKGKVVVDVRTEFDKEESFVMFRVEEGGVLTPGLEEEQIRGLVDERVAGIELVARKICTR